MSNLLRLSFCALFACSFALHAQQVSEMDAGSAKDELIRLEKQWAAALGDHAFLNSIAADDYVIVDAGGDVRSKQQELALDEKFDTSTFDPLSVRVHGDSAVVVGRYSISGTNSGEAHSETGVSTDTWIKRGDKWLLVSSQNTSLPATSQTDANGTKETGGDVDRVLAKKGTAIKNSQQVPKRDSQKQSASDVAMFVAKEKEDWEALKHKDKAAAGRLLADDFVGMYDFGFFNKSEWVKQLDDHYTIEDYTIADAKLLRPSSSTALLLYNARCKGTGDWTEFCSHVNRTSDLFVQRNGEWLSLFSQDTTATSGGESDDAVMKAIVANEQRIFEILKRNDITAFGSMLPDDLIDVEDDGIHTKPEWLKEFEEQKKAGLLFTDFKMEDLRLVRYSPLAATLVFRETIDGTQNGKAFVWHINSSSGYVKRGGKWVPVLYQDVTAK